MVTPGQYTDNFLHTVYPDPGTIGDLATRDHVGMMLLTHSKAMGKITSYPFRLNGPQGHGFSRTDSQFVADNQTSTAIVGGGGRSTVGEWLVTNGDYTGSVVIRDKDIEEGDASNEASYLRAVVMETDGLIEEFGEVFETYIMGTQDKSLATVSTATSATTGVNDANGIIVLATPEDAHNFHVGMALVAVDQSAPTVVLGTVGTTAATTGIGWVIAVDTELGTITTSNTQGGAATVIATWETANDTNPLKLYRYGDVQGGIVTNTTGSSSNGYIVDGFQDWITPTSTPGTKFGVDRNMDSRLSGVRLSATKSVGSIENRILQAATELQLTSGNKGPLKAIINSRQWTKLVGELKSRGVTPHESTVKGATTSFGYSAIYVDLPQGRCEVVPSPHIPQTLLLLLNLKSWHFCATKGMFPRVMNGDGLKLLRKATSDNYEFRTTCYAHLACQYPSWNARATLAAV
jgi:hypothetical protein